MLLTAVIVASAVAISLPSGAALGIRINGKKLRLKFARQLRAEIRARQWAEETSACKRELVADLADNVLDALLPLRLDQQAPQHVEAVKEVIERLQTAKEWALSDRRTLSMPLESIDLVQVFEHIQTPHERGSFPTSCRVQASFVRLTYALEALLRLGHLQVSITQSPERAWLEIRGRARWDRIVQHGPADTRDLPLCTGLNMLRHMGAELHPASDHLTIAFPAASLQRREPAQVDEDLVLAR